MPAWHTDMPIGAHRKPGATGWPKALNMLIDGWAMLLNIDWRMPLPHMAWFIPFAICGAEK